MLFLIGQETDVLSDWLDFGCSFLKITHVCHTQQSVLVSENLELKYSFINEDLIA